MYKKANRTIRTDILIGSASLFSVCFFDDIIAFRHRSTNFHGGKNTMKPNHKNIKRSV